MDWIMQIWGMALAITSWGAGILLGLVMLAGVVIAAAVALLAIVIVFAGMWVAMLLVVDQVRKLRANRRCRKAEGVE